MKEISLTKGMVALVDDEDYERVSLIGKWLTITTKRGYFYAAHSFHVKNKPNRLIYMHRFIMNTPDEMLCDHINHNTLDNRKSNLRNCTRGQNLMNSKVNKKSTTGYKCINRKNNQYRVHIRANGKTAYERKFKTLEEAIQARDEQLKIHHGEYANTGE